MVHKYSISLNDATLQELDFLRRRIGLSPDTKRSALISAVIYRCYVHEVEAASEPPTDPPKPHPVHGSHTCDGDCDHCADEPICDYSRCIDRFIV